MYPKPEIFSLCLRSHTLNLARCVRHHYMMVNILYMCDSHTLLFNAPMFNVYKTTPNRLVNYEGTWAILMPRLLYIVSTRHCCTLNSYGCWQAVFMYSNPLSFSMLLGHSAISLEFIKHLRIGRFVIYAGKATQQIGPHT